MDAILGFLDSFPGMLGTSLRVVVGLVALDVIFGIARAIRLKEFSFIAVAAFYRTMVLPYIIGYVGLVAAAKFLGEATLPEPYGLIVSTAMIGVGWAALVGTLARSIWHNMYTLYRGIPEWEWGSANYLDQIHEELSELEAAE